jgi:hypothetical protein
MIQSPSDTRHDCSTRNLVIPYTVELTVLNSCCEYVYTKALCHQTTGSFRKWVYFLLKISSLYAIRTTRGQVHSDFALLEAQNNSLGCDTEAVSASLQHAYRQVLLTARYNFEELHLLSGYAVA